MIGTEGIALRYINPYSGQSVTVVGNKQVATTQELAQHNVPHGVEYEVLPKDEALGENVPVRELHVTKDGGFFDAGTIRHQLGYFGNIWVRQNYIPKAGVSSIGHTHHFDHVSLLVQGRVLVEVDGCEPKEFTAPTFIIIKKEYKHKFTALEDGALWFCVFALRDENGDVTDVYSGDNSPYGIASLKGLKAIEEMTDET